MGLRRIRVLGETVLRKKAKKTTRFNDNLKALVEDMIETMRDGNGVGLAAPQVGILERVIVVEIPHDDEEPDSGQLYTVINPEMVRASKELVDGIEGCLSIPGYVGEVSRHEAITIRGQDRKGRKTRIKAQGYLARVFQHEIDHLEGVLFIDQLTAPDHVWRVEEGEEEQVAAQGVTTELVPADLPLELTQV